MIKRIGCLWLLSSVLFAETVVVKPNRYYETFAAHEPVARIRPGDSVVTKLLDSRGKDETGKLILDGVLYRRRRTGRYADHSIGPGAAESGLGLERSAHFDRCLGTEPYRGS